MNYTLKAFTNSESMAELSPEKIEKVVVQEIPCVNNHTLTTEVVTNHQIRSLLIIFAIDLAANLLVMYKEIED